MKRYKNLHQEIYKCGNLFKAYKTSRKGKGKKSYVIEFEANLEENLKQIQTELINETWQPAPYKKFQVYDPKHRIIHAPIFRDRVVQHALMQILEPIFDKRFIYDSYASRKNKGTHAGVKRLTEFLKRYDKGVYVLKCDVRKFFENIDHDVLIKAIRKKIADERLIKLIIKILKNDGLEKGVTLGNYTSQWFANIILNELDYYAKQKLRIKEYVRYMDDFLMLSQSKDELHKWKHKLKDFLHNELKLEMHKRKRLIFPAHIGTDFLGYVSWIDHRRLRKRNIKRFLKRIKAFEKQEDISQEHIEGSIMSWKGYSDCANSYNLNQSLITEHSLVGMIYE